MVLFPAKFAAIGPAIMGSLGGLSESLTTAATALGGSLAAGVAAGLVLGLAGVWILLKTGVLEALSNLGVAIQESPVGSLIMDALKIVLAPIGSIGAAIIDIVKGDLASIPEDMAEPFNQAGDAIERYIDRMYNVTSDGVSSISYAFSGLGSSLAGASGAMTAMAVSAFSGISGAFQGMSGQIQGVFAQMMSALQSLINSTAGGFFNAGQNIIVNMVNGILAAAGGIVNAIQGVFQQIANMIPHSPAKEGPLAQVPNWGAYLSGGMPEAESSVKTGMAGVAQAVVDTTAAPVAQAGAAAGKPSGAGGDVVTISPGAIVINGAGQNATQIADMVIQRFSDVRRQKGIRS
jgi:phage-related protein